MLEPNNRQLLRDALRPPSGYVLDRAITTTFSLDLMALLTIPVSFTFFQLKDQDGPPQVDPLALLEALRRYAGQITVFHTYCHAVMHWNLPANPVDMEQREGRVHRYKGHAVRRNVARQHTATLTNDPHGDPWSRLFETARAESDDPSGLKPYWVYPVEGGATIERHVSSLPLSREANQLPALRNSLAVSRMVFGQPRQDDLVEFLLRQIPRETLAGRLDHLRIDLAPREVPSQVSF